MEVLLANGAIAPLARPSLEIGSLELDLVRRDERDRNGKLR
jgi:hypothetical protein